jgi:NAD+ synthase
MINLHPDRNWLDFRNWAEVKEDEKLELGNIKARTRMTILYYYANKENKLVAGTGDKSEILTGYFTKYGDGGVDFLPIGDLYKTHVRDLSREMGVPEKIVSKPSSPGLWKGQTAEGELGIEYETLDRILYDLVDKGLPIEEIDYDRKTVEYVDRLFKRSAHKRDPLPKAEVVYCEQA